MRLILVRHAETNENKKGIIQGQKDAKLNENGIIQAKKIALRLKDEKINIIYSSDLSRAFDTAKEISKFHKKVKLISTKELRERSHGKREGMKAEEIDWSVGSEYVGGESREDLMIRANNFLHLILSKHKHENVLFVCHGAIGRAFISIITGKKFKEIQKLHNTSVSVFEIDEDKNHKTHLFNCIKHLD